MGAQKEHRFQKGKDNSKAPCKDTTMKPKPCFLQRARLRERNCLLGKLSSTIKELHFLQILFLVSDSSLFIAAHSDVICQRFKFLVDNDVIYNHVLEGHVFRRSTVHNPAQCHMMCKDDCLCISKNYFPVSGENNCELNDVNKEMEPAALKWKQGVNCYDLMRSYIIKDGGNYLPAKHACTNRCCHDSPCVNGGQCQEICDPRSTRFNCTCPDTYTGRRCDKIRHPRTCKDIAKNGASTSREYSIFDSANQSFSVFCDMESSGLVWALIQSFSLANNPLLKNTMFGDDSPMNHACNNVVWNLYRLSLQQMWSIAKQSTHFRATCNFPTEGPQYTDYARAKLEVVNIFGTYSSTCLPFEYVNIRGNECSNCTAHAKQQSGKAWTMNSYQSKLQGCQFDGSPGAKGDEQNFGRYISINTDHRCSSSPNSTTQHWLGVKRDF